MENDDAFANAPYVPDGDSYPDRWRAAAEAFRAKVPGEQGVAYGDSPRQTYDFYAPEGPAKGTVIFIHGGYWLKFSPSYFSHLAAGPLARGWAVAMPSYDLAPDVRIAEITAQIAAAVEAIAARTEGPLVITGHSAGGHLTARMGNSDITLSCRDRIKRLVPISPVADLGPLMKTSMNADLRIDAVEALLESPARHERPSCDVSIWVGEDERPVFVQQARTLHRVWCGTMQLVPGAHHFDIIAPLADPESALTQDVTPEA